jgi:hypothetical protein
MHFSLLIYVSNYPLHVSNRLTVHHQVVVYCTGGADKSLARPGRKQATATEDFDVHISCL